MKSIKMNIIIKENNVNAEGNVTSTVGITFYDATKGAFVGDYEKFDGSDLTNEQISGAVQRLMMMLLPMVPDVEEAELVPPEVKGVKFKRTYDGKFVPA